MIPSLLYRAAQRGLYGRRHEYEQGSITDALFVFLDGKPDPESTAALEAHFTDRPCVCLTDEWYSLIQARYPGAAVYQRYMMKPACRFRIPETAVLPEGYRLSLMDRAAFDRHPFSQAENYASYDSFRAEGSGAVIYRDGAIISSASSFLSLDGETELDVSTEEAYRGKGLAGACISRMLQDCMERGITVHWDAQNEISLHLAEKFGFVPETVYSVYWPAKGEHKT